MIILYDRFSVAPDSLLVNNLKNKHSIVEDHYCENVILKIILNTELSFFFFAKTSYKNHCICQLPWLLGIDCTAVTQNGQIKIIDCIRIANT